MTNSDWALYMGCVIPNRLPYMELAIRETLRHFDIPSQELDGFTCCPNPLTLPHLDDEAALAIAARNLAIAESKELPILTPCHGCFETLKGAAVRLKSDNELLGKINKILGKIGHEYKGTTQVKHFIQLLYEDIGPDAIAEAVINPLADFDAALHVGCHILRPSHLLEVNDAQRPVLLDQLVRAIGITPIRYQDEMDCCGYGTRQADRDLSLNMLGNKLSHMKEAGAQAIIVICPACTLAFDLLQRMALRFTSDKEPL
ncbi:MAG: CoB--CoM heterodisulfide reductase iron-sulfur subunit B family protein, partial [Promethearchaeota archaeon]